MLQPCLRGATLNQLGSPVVTMIQSTESVVRNDPPGKSSPLVPFEPEMCAVLVVVNAI